MNEVYAHIKQYVISHPEWGEACIQADNKEFLYACNNLGAISYRVSTQILCKVLRRQGCVFLGYVRTAGHFDLIMEIVIQSPLKQ